MTSPARRTAFTLLELILAMGIVAMITLALYSAMRTAFRARTTTAMQNAASRPAAIMLDVIQRDLESVALPTSAGLGGPFTGYAMGTTAGQADGISFYTIGRDFTPAVGTASAAAMSSATVVSPFSEGTRYVEYGLGSANGESVLIRRVGRNVLSTTAVPPEEEVLARGVRSFALRYYDGVEWTEEWDSASQSNALPLAVEISIEMDQPGARDPDRPYRMSRFIPIIQQNDSAEATGSTQS